jgi:CHAD domain-containing protein
MKKLDVSLHADEPLRAGLLRVADGLIQNASDCIKCSTSHRAEDVHLVRVTIKRLRAMLRLIRPVISKAVFDRENARLRKAACRLSLARDSVVARQTLATLPLSKGRERDAVAAALAGFDDDGEPEAEISKTMNQVELDLEQTRRNLHRIRISAHEWKAVEPGLRGVYRQCRKRMERALGQGDDEAFHRWRIRVKNLYYGLQMLQRVWPERIDKMVARLRRLQEEIGADHDLVVLKRSMRKTSHAFDGTEAVEQVVDSLDDKSRKLRRVIEPLGRAIFDQTSRGFVRELGQRWNNWRKA